MNQVGMWFGRVACLVALIGCGLLAAPPAGQAQTYVPSVKIGTASLISPSAADSYYSSSTTATNGLGATSRPPEIVELARALKNSPDRIYEYVLNNIDVVWMYGLQKGALGAAIDKAGTPFDQAMLMIELLRQAGYTASYQAGTITLTGAQFTAWTGIGDATAACQMLSSGGFPAAVNGSTTANCSYGTGTAITSVQMAHIWVQATIGGTNCIFDPSYKAHIWKTGINLTTATGLSTGAPLSQASSGMSSGTTSGVNYVTNLNSENLNSTLASYASNVLGYLTSNTVSGTTTPLYAGQLEDIIGGGVIIPYVSPSGGLRQTTLPYASSVAHGWSGNIPDQYRTTLRVQGTNNDTGAAITSMFDKTFFVDEIYGRRLTVDTNFNESEILSMSDYSTFKVYLRLDGVALVTYTNTSSHEVPNHRKYSTITLTANHPYAASADGSATTNGDYMDATVVKSAMLVTPIAIVHGWGDTGPQLLAKWSSERAGDKGGPWKVAPQGSCPADNCVPDYVSPVGDFTREKMVAGWLAQVSRATRMHAAIAGAVEQLHHQLGVLYADDYAPASAAPDEPGAFDYAVAASYTRLDVDSGISLTSKTADAVARRAALHAIAATSAALEGSIAGQMQDVPDTSSTASRFEWGNRPPSAEDPLGAGPRGFAQFTPANGSSAPALARWEGQLTPPASNLNDNAGNPQANAANFLGSYASVVQSYTGAGFTVVASQEVFLGPGQRGGWYAPPSAPNTNWTFAETEQRGAAMVATRYVGSDPVEIAQIVTGEHGLANKGGGGSVEPNTNANYAPAEAADVMKAKFVDRANALGVDLSNGSLAYSSPVGLTTGTGGFPYALSANLVFHPQSFPPRACRWRPSPPCRCPKGTGCCSSSSASPADRPRPGAAPGRAAGNSADGRRDWPKARREIPPSPS